MCIITRTNLLHCTLVIYRSDVQLTIIIFNGTALIAIIEHGLRNGNKPNTVLIRKRNHENRFIWLFALVLIGIASHCTTTTCPEPIVTLEVYEDQMVQIRQTLLDHPPNSGDLLIREQTIMSLDDILSVESSRDSANVFEFYAAMMQKVSNEIDVEVHDGLRIWMMYNHGFIIKTPQNTFAFDLIDGYNGWQRYWSYELPENVVNALDVLFISHQHLDHMDETLIQKIRAHGGMVIESTPDEPLYINGMKVDVHLGLHNIENRIFEVTTTNGFKILHTGDNQTSEALPLIENIDVLLLNAWVNESGSTYGTYGMRNCINKLKPTLMIPGHIHELFHDVDSRANYKWSFYINDGSLPSAVQVMAWGECYDVVK